MKSLAEDLFLNAGWKLVLHFWCTVVLFFAFTPAKIWNSVQLDAAKWTVSESVWPQLDNSKKNNNIILYLLLQQNGDENYANSFSKVNYIYIG